MDTEALKTFIAIADSGSFSLAAEQLFLTQPAISKRISLLEDQLNARLFDRIGRQITLTEAGRKLLPHAQKIMLEIDASRREILDLGGEVAGQLSIAISHHIGLHRLPPVLKSYSQQYPEVALDIRFTDSEAAHEEILHGGLELAVVTIAPKLDPKLHAIQIWEDPLLFVTAHDHPLRSMRNNKIRLQEIAGHVAILPSDNTYTGQLIEALFRKHRLRTEALMRTNYLETIKMMVSIGLGWSVLPESMLDEQISKIDVPGADLRRSLGCVHHRDRTLSNAAKAFLDLLMSQRSDQA